ncbi:MAG: hypothetical protein AAFN81_33675, partial [Bacteroidota bacterium]
MIHNLIPIFYGLFLLMGLASYGQTAYVCSEYGGLYLVDIGNCSSTLIGNSSSWVKYYDIAYCASSNTLYGVDIDGDLYIINQTDATRTFVANINFPGGMGVLEFNSLVCDPTGLLYVAAKGTSIQSIVSSYDPGSGTNTLLGFLPYGINPAGDLTFIGTDLYMIGNGNLYLVDTLNPSLTTQVTNYGLALPWNAYGVFSTFDCSSGTPIETTYLVAGNDLYSAPGTSVNVTLDCNNIIPYTIYGAASLSEVGCPLPVTLSYFETSQTDGQLYVEWRSVNETNNDYFVLEASSDRQNWQALATIAGAANTASPQSYSYTGAVPYSGTNYFRLK